MSEAPDWYDAQMSDDAMLGSATAERKWHGTPKPTSYRQDLRDCCIRFDALVHSYREEKAGETWQTN